MKTQFILSLFLLSVVTVGAKTIHKIENPTYVGINNGTMKIVSVKTTEEATVLTFQYPGEGFYQFAPNIHLVDEQGNHYELIGQKGFSEDSLKNLKPTKKGKYELRFQPLPDKTRIFDFIEDFYSWTGTSYYGIRNEDTPFAVSNPLPHNEGKSSVPDIDFKKDSVIITGHIKSYNADSCKFHFVGLSGHHAPTFKFYYGSDIYNRNVATIDENGNFKLSVQVYGPTWTYLMFTSKGKLENYAVFLPIMLYPNDQTSIEISHLEGEEHKEIKYNSKLQKDCSKLMNCAPMILTQLEHSDDSVRYERLTEKNIKVHFKEYDAMALYLSGKYGLNRMETEMLRSQLSVVVGIKIIKLTNRALSQKHRYSDNASKKEKKEKRKAWKESDSPYYKLVFSSIRATNNLFMTTPDWSRLLQRSQLKSISRYNRIVDDFYKTTEDFKNKDVKQFFNQRLKLIREWRQKGDNDDIFEHAYLLCNTLDMPYPLEFRSLMDEEALKRFLPDRFQGISKSRELFTHPSFVRLAGELLYEREKYLYRELEEMAEGENAQQ